MRKEQRKRLLQKFPPITFISAEKGYESKSEFSYRNYYEAKFIVALLDYLTTLIYHKFNGIPYKDANRQQNSSSESSCSEQDDNLDEGPDQAEGSIGVILTYRSQVELIKQMILESPNRAMHDIQVSTVDAF